jgi:glucosyl-3-phosphoglycerate synthase
MSDFHQTGVITTLHRLGKLDIEKLERKLERCSRERPIALVLPSLYSELEGEALPKIINVIKDLKYISQVVITLGRADKKQFKHAKEFFSVLSQEVKILWDDGKRIQSLYRLLEKNGLETGDRGKGRQCWLAYGYILASGKCRVIALHDCDILTYDRELLARLCYPTTSPTLDYEFCKGYYSRVTNKLHGRVMRLLITPLVRSLESVIGNNIQRIPFLTYMDSFRYPLSGEFSMAADLARINRIPSDWGLEVGVLAEVYRNCAPNRVCQVELCENYDHKHQVLSAEDPEQGLLKMSVDICKSIFRTLAAEGIVFSEGFFRTLQTKYLRTSQDTIKRYEDDAAINSLDFDRHEEGLAVEAFTKGIKMASEVFIQNPFEIRLIPNWNRVDAAIPDFLPQLNEAVEKDNE